MAVRLWGERPRQHGDKIIDGEEFKEQEARV